MRHALSFLGPCIDQCRNHDIRIISNLGGADPLAVANGVQRAVGDDVTVLAVVGDALPLSDNDGQGALAKNAYVGAEGIVEALKEKADIVITGRVADPALVVGPVVHELGLRWDDWDAIATATLSGHLIECGTQVSGGYFANEASEVPDLTHVGPPVAAVTADHIVLSKPVGGGRLSRETVIQQLLYEVGDPSAYLTPDVVLDMTNVQVKDLEDGVIEVSGALGRERPAQLKTLLCRSAGWFGESEISYFGSTAGDRTLAARDILSTRLDGMDKILNVFRGEMDGVPMARLRPGGAQR